ncbi:MAG: U32 family peptidase [Deferrisomatales bacterium]
MNVLAPIRAAEEVAALCRAGADEFYCGTTPPGWSERYGATWAHRRDPRSAGVPDCAEIGRIAALAAPRPVYATLNAPWYPAGAVPLLVEFGRRLLEEHGVQALIVADTELLLALAEAGLAGRVHLSSLATCTNSGAASWFRGLGVGRIILPRHLTVPEIEAIVTAGGEFEVFALNDGCVFEEGLCATTHARGVFCLGDGPGTAGVGEEALERYEFWKWTLTGCGCRTSRGYPLGPCGLCAIPRFLAAGVASLKVVGREASLERKVASVRLTARARDLARSGAGREEIRRAVLALRGGRSLCEGAHLCYYPDVWGPLRREARAC